MPLCGFCVCVLIVTVRRVELMAQNPAPPPGPTPAPYRTTGQPVIQQGHFDTGAFASDWDAKIINGQTSAGAPSAAQPALVATIAVVMAVCVAILTGYETQR